MAEATKKPAPPPLARASEATDPAVHQIIAEMQTAQMNGDADVVSALVKQLADLGYE